MIEVKVISKVEGKRITQYIILQDSIEDLYVNKEAGISFKGRFGLVTLNENNILQEFYIGNGNQLSHHQKTFVPDDSSHCTYQKM